MKRKMTRTQYLYNSAMEELDEMIARLNKRIADYFDGKK
jgi:exonuclease VII small subunit